jgi:hypothetical protein
MGFEVDVEFYDTNPIPLERILKGEVRCVILRYEPNSGLAN